MVLASSNPSQHLLSICPFYYSYPDASNVASQETCNFMSLITNDINYLLMCLVPISMSLFVTSSVAKSWTSWILPEISTEVMGIRESSLTNTMCLSHQVLLKLHKAGGFFSARIMERTHSVVTFITSGRKASL